MDIDFKDIRQVFVNDAEVNSVTLNGQEVWRSGEYPYLQVWYSDGSTKRYKVSDINSITVADKEKVVEAVIGNQVRSILISAFSGCTGLTSVTIGSGVTIIGQQAFSGCSSLTSITIGSSVTSIGSSAFYKCSGLTSVIIPNSVTSIGGSAFQGCSSLTSISIPNSVTSIGSSAFSGTAWYNNQPDGLVYAGKVAYKYKGTMPSGTHITLEEDTVGIAQYAFQSCRNITSVTMYDNVRTIGAWAFQYCSGLPSINIPGSVETIEAYAFSDCGRLNEVVINEGVRTLGKQCFYNCGFARIRIPSSVSIIKGSVFTILSEAIMEAVVPPKLEGTLATSGVTKIYVPDMSVDAYKVATNWKQYADIIYPISQRPNN